MHRGIKWIFLQVKNNQHLKFLIWNQWEKSGPYKGYSKIVD